MSLNSLTFLTLSCILISGLCTEIQSYPQTCKKVKETCLLNPATLSHDCCAGQFCEKSKCCSAPQEQCSTKDDCCTHLDCVNQRCCINNEVVTFNSTNLISCCPGWEIQPVRVYENVTTKHCCKVAGENCKSDLECCSRACDGMVAGKSGKCA